MTRRENVSIHTPTRGVTVCVSHRCQWLNISIHTPTRGVTKFCTGSGSFPKFQSTLPQGEWRAITNYFAKQKNFNPHSHKGSDHMRLRYILWFRLFQSTLPQGEWPLPVIYLTHSVLFQSTLPQGEWQVKKMNVLVSRYFNPHSHKGSDETTRILHIM